MKKLLMILVILSVLCACERRQEIVYVPQQPQPVQQMQVQPVYAQNPDPMSGIITGMVIGSLLSNGTRYDGHNGYGDSRYRGPSQRIVVNQTVVNKYNSKPGSTVTTTTTTPIAPAKASFANKPAVQAPVKAASFASRPSTPTPSRPSFSSSGSSRSSSSSSFSRRK